jgi:calcineurin-like phosphoesterase family protein
MDYFTSDIHFGHKDVIRFCKRPYRTVSEMNESIIKNWNNVVGDTDRVFLVGDVFLCGSSEAGGYIKRLNGHKVLIKGNHDRNKKKMLEVGFDEFHKEYEYTMPDGRLALIKHYPGPDCIMDEKYDLLIHGHIHVDNKVNGKKINVSTDIWNYTPVNIETLNSLDLDTELPGEFIDVSIDEYGILEIKCKLRMEDFSGAADYVYKEMSKLYPSRGKK